MDSVTNITPREINYFDSVLPRNVDILSMIFGCLENKTKTNSKLYHTNIKTNYKQISDNVIKIWCSLSIPIVTEKIVYKKVEELHTKYRNMKSNYQRNRQYSFEFVNNLFIISRCKCFIDGKKSECSCDQKDKIAPNVMGFYLDQLGPRTLTINNVSMQSPSEVLENLSASSTTIQLNASTASTNTSLDCSKRTTDSEYVPSSEPSDSSNLNLSCDLNPNKSVSRKDLESLGMLCDAKDISIRDSALLISSAFEVAGARDGRNNPVVIERNKMHRIRKACRATSLARKFSETRRIK